VRVAVVGHVEWVRFARVDRIPVAGAVAHASDSFEEPAGGGAVAAVQLARLAGGATLFTALGDDEHGRRTVERLGELGVEVRAQVRPGVETRSAVTLVDDAGERTITTFGPRPDPCGAELGELGELDAVYFTAGDVDALRAVRAASRVLVASPRARHALGHGVELDALVLSAHDEIEQREAANVRLEARVVVETEGERGGRYDGQRYEPAPAPTRIGDAYGCGDSFAAGFAYGLASGMGIEQGLALGARCGAACLGGRGPYESQLTARDL
jgi:ribokinase